MEEEGTQKPPLLPANYVSLAVLQQRWQKEQQRKEEEEERKLGEKEEETPNPEKNQNQTSPDLSKNRRPDRKLEESRSDNGKGKRDIVDEDASNSVSINQRSKRKKEKSRFGKSRVQIEREDRESKKNLKWGKNEWRPKVVENLDAGNVVEKKILGRISVIEGEGNGAGNKAEKKSLVVVRERDGFDKKVSETEKKSSVPANRRQRNKADSKIVVAVREEIEAAKKNIPVAGNEVASEGNKVDNEIQGVKSKMAEVRCTNSGMRYNGLLLNQTEIAQKFEGLSVNHRRERNASSERKYNYSGRFGRPKMEKGTHSGHMWVPKGEKIGTDATGSGN